MIIRWIGHSCFKIEEGDYSIVLDPYADGMVPGLLPVKEEANLVIASHEHDDHNARGNVTVIEYGGESPIKIESISTFHDEVRGEKRGENSITILESKDARIAHLGDLGCELEEEQKKLLEDLDALLIPIGGFYTIDSDEAYKLVEEIEPRIAIPMHFRSDNFGFDVISTNEHFIELAGIVTELDVSEIDTKDEFDTRAVFLKPRNEK